MGRTEQRIHTRPKEGTECLLEGAYPRCPRGRCVLEHIRTIIYRGNNRADVLECSIGIAEGLGHIEQASEMKGELRVIRATVGRAYAYLIEMTINREGPCENCREVES